MKILDYVFTCIIGMLFGVFAMIIFSNCTNTYVLPKGRNLVSYEYTKQCQCGESIEGYQSLADGFNQEECKSCGYHAEFEK